MNISLNKEDFSIDNVYFNEPIRNSIIENSSFIRVIYSNELMAINGIYIKIDFDNVTKINDFSKQKITININDNLKIINYIKSIEIEILEKINIERKKKIYKINEQLMSGYIKHLIDNKYANCFILKISGIWESENEYGLTFKFIEINRL
jgi:intein/homing endonuclease